MVNRNPHIAKLHGAYLFPVIHKKKHELLKRVPDAKIISLGIGDTTEPLSKHIVSGLEEGARKLGTREGYTGYGPEQGHEQLRKKIAEVIYGGAVEHDEVFISDGSKCDIGRLQVLFGKEIRLAVQDPSYPVYVDTGVIIGQTGPYSEAAYEKIIYLKCTPENKFFANLGSLPKIDVIYFCSPNNPTGASATKEQLKDLVHFAIDNRTIIVFDAAYSSYIRTPTLPVSIYEIEGAKKVAIELNSFSKMAGFTGVRLGWSVVPKELVYNDGSPVRTDWQRINSTFFNGASVISQSGALAALSSEGLAEMRAMTDFYLENAILIKKTWESLGFTVYGGINAPYLWVHFPGRQSWDVFNDLLEKCHILSTPGAGFGPSGEGFVRFTSFGHREMIEEALTRIRKNFTS